MNGMAVIGIMLGSIWIIPPVVVVAAARIGHAGLAIFALLGGFLAIAVFVGGTLHFIDERRPVPDQNQIQHRAAHLLALQGGLR